MSTARELSVDRERHLAWLRAGLVMLLLLAFCCTVPVEQRPAGPGPMRRVDPVATATTGGTDVRAVAHTRATPPARRDPEITIRLNLPAFRLDVLEAGAVSRSYAVAVGTARYPTPRRLFAITRVIWNPWWYPPDSDWARKEKVTPPGPQNPMGKVKLQLGGPYFVHGTPWPLSVGHAASHGCIRMLNDDAIALARLVQLAGGAAVNAATTDSLAGALYDTREFALPRPVPFQITYDLAELRGDTLMVYPDVYRLARGAIRGHILAVLAQAEYDTTAVDRAVLRRLVTLAARRPQAMLVDSLIPLPADPRP